MDPQKNNRLLVIMPAHNEAEFIGSCLDSFVNQDRHPDLLLIVDDNSSDSTADIVREYAEAHDWICLEPRRSETGHRPGAKVVAAFNQGLEVAGRDYAFIGKFDADIVLPPGYFREVLAAFEADAKLGICSGLLYTEKEGRLSYEPIADRSHVRGPVKLYTAECFSAIGGLQPSIGWDTADVLLARYHGFGVETLPSLKVVHQRPTGSAYSRVNARLQGASLYKLRYGWALSTLSSLKMAWKRRQPGLPFQHLAGYLKAGKSGGGRLFDPDAGRFARHYRWQQIRRKLF